MLVEGVDLGHGVRAGFTARRGGYSEPPYESLNLGLAVGLDKVAETYVQLGLEQAPAAYPSMLLGAANLSPFDVAQMYNTLANGGFRSPLRAVRAVLDENGKALKAPELEIDATEAADAVYALDRMLIEVMDRGTGRPARKDLPEGITVAGKTGTSNDYRDSWFAGFSGGHLIVVWVGHDDNSSTGLTGTTGALPVWSKLMSSLSTLSFEPVLPEDLEERWIDYYSGEETSPYCSGAAVPSKARCTVGCVVSLMVASPDLSACQLAKPACRATSSCASLSLKLCARICASLKSRKRGSTALICAATG